MTNYPTYSYYEYLKTLPRVKKMFNYNDSAITYERLKSSILGLNVFYEELSYVKTTEQPQTELSDLIANIGG
jgi:hypothetical protein